VKRVAVLFVFTALAVLAVDTPYQCSGSAACASDCQSSSVNCSLSGTINGNWSCHTASTQTSIACEVRDEEGNQIAYTIEHCSNCGGSGGGSGGTDPGSGGEYCDPVDPLWWVWCNPFPVI
jgi:hypothetical protein